VLGKLQPTSFPLDLEEEEPGNEVVPYREWLLNNVAGETICQAFEKLKTI
jgi:hypothetical protein